MTSSGDVARVREAFAGGRLLHPGEGAANTVDLAKAMASLGGVELPLSEPGLRLKQMIGRHEHYVFVLADGLGMNLIDALPESSFLRSHMALEMRAVFPSSTAPALTSIATASWPAEHGVPGWWTYLSDEGITVTVLPFIERFGEQPLDQARVPSASVFRVPAIAGTFAHEFMMFTPAKIAGSVYSRYSSSDAPFLAYKTMAHGVDAVVNRVRGASIPTYSYLYIPHVDTAGHLHGPHSAQSAAALAEVETEIARLGAELAGHARIVLTADHGQFTIASATVVDRTDPLMRMLTVPPTGDGRSPLFHVASGQRHAFAAAFRATYGAGFALLSIEEAEELRLFGPMPLATEMRRRVGDFVGIAFGDDVILYEPDKDEELRGHHGGLTPNEMRIPLVLV